jgi:hypothetical protein
MVGREGQAASATQFGMPAFYSLKYPKSVRFLTRVALLQCLKLYRRLSGFVLPSYSMGINEHQSREFTAILLVEDDDEVRENLINLVESRGYRIVAATNEDSSVEAVLESRQQIGLILVDQKMISAINFLLLHLVQTASCNRHHAGSERLPRWLLMMHDRVVGDSLPMRQEFLAWMLGVTTGTVILAAIELQDAGLIEYRRGKIIISDRKKLEEKACSCVAAHSLREAGLIDSVRGQALRKTAAKTLLNRRVISYTSHVEYPFPPVGIVGAADGKNRRAFLCLRVGLVHTLPAKMTFARQVNPSGPAESLRLISPRFRLLSHLDVAC